MAYLPWREGSSPTSDARWMLAAVGEEEGCGMLTLTLVRQAQRYASSKLQEGITKVCESTCCSWDNSAVPCNILIFLRGATGTASHHVQGYGRVFSPKTTFQKKAGPSSPRGSLLGLSCVCGAISEGLGLFGGGSWISSTACGWGEGQRPGVGNWGCVCGCVCRWVLEGWGKHGKKRTLFPELWEPPACSSTPLTKFEGCGEEQIGLAWRGGWAGG